MGNEKQEDSGTYIRENRIVFFLKSNRFFCLISFLLALAISCVLIFVVVSKYFIITVGTGLIFISSFTIVLSFFVYVPIRYLSKKNK